MISIRAFLLSRLVGGAVLVLAGAAAAVYLVVERSLAAQFDRNLADRVQGLASLLFQVGEHVEFEFSDELMPEYERAERPAYFELRFAGGELLERSRSLAGAELAVPVAAERSPRCWTARLPDGREGRFAAQLVEVHHVHPEEGPDRPRAAEVRIVVARGREELVAAGRRVLLACAAGAVALIGLVATLALAAVGRGLEPTQRLASAVEALDVHRLPERLDAGPLPVELEPVQRTIDALIAKAREALERERRTSADIAHELRTPISELLTVSEVVLRDGHDPRQTRRALETVRDVASRMGASVATLLALARLEMGAEAFRREEVDLARTVRESLRSLAALGRERGLRVESSLPDTACIEGDGDVVRIVVSNLLGNAVQHCPPGGTVSCGLERTAAGWGLRVTNAAGDLRPEDLRALTQPFWRKDRSRTDRSRSGLGLALSGALAEKGGLELGFELEDGAFSALLRARPAPRGTA